MRTAILVLAAVLVSTAALSDGQGCEYLVIGARSSSLNRSGTATGGTRQIADGATSHEAGSYREFVCKDGKLYWTDNGELVQAEWAISNRK